MNCNDLYSLSFFKKAMFLEKKSKLKSYYDTVPKNKQGYIKNFMKSLLSKMKKQIKTTKVEDIEKIQNNYFYEKTK